MQLHNSEVEVQNQTLRMPVDVTGTPYNLYYHSDRVPGRKAAYSVDIPLRGENIPDSLQTIVLEIQVAGQQHTHQFPRNRMESYTFMWDGKDGYGRYVSGPRPITVRIGYVYRAQYYEPADFSRAFSRFGYGSASGGAGGGSGGGGGGSGTTGAAMMPPPILADRAREEISIWKEWTGTVGTWNTDQLGAREWSLDVHHAYDPLNETLYLGTGERRDVAGHGGAVIDTVAGSKHSVNGENNRATQTQLRHPQRVATGPDGSIYIAEFNHHVIRRVRPDGVIAKIAGSGEAGYNGDDGPATDRKSVV